MIENVNLYLYYNFSSENLIRNQYLLYTHELSEINLLLISGPLVSPASTTLFVVVKVSQATLEKGSFEINVSTTISDIRSQTLSGWPSDTDS